MTLSGGKTDRVRLLFDNFDILSRSILHFEIKENVFQKSSLV